MNVEVGLARHSAPWRFRGSPGFEKWLARRPWTEAGGVRTLLVDADASSSAIVEGVRRAVLATDGGASGLSVLTMTVREGESFWPALQRELELPAVTDDRSGRQAVGQYLQGRPPTLVLCATASANPAGPWHEAAARLCDGLAKETVPLPLTVVFVAQGRDWSSHPVDDFTQGEPVEPVLGAHTESAQLLWPRYVHARVAWEAGGRPALAMGIDESLEAVAPANDSALERGLSAASQALWTRVAGEHRQLLLDWLSGGALARDPRGLALLQSGLLWQPSAGAHPQPVPWVARALLLGEKRPAAQRALLRGGLVCQPLSLEVLGRCFALELRLRARTGALSDRNPPQDAQDYFAEFQSQPQSLVRLLYPGGSPALPEDAWGFASLGQLLRALNVPHHSEVKDLADLRNALAHGHYAGWAALETMRKLEGRLMHW